MCLLNKEFSCGGPGESWGSIMKKEEIIKRYNGAALMYSIDVLKDVADRNILDIFVEMDLRELDAERKPLYIFREGETLHVLCQDEYACGVGFVAYQHRFANIEIRLDKDALSVRYLDGAVCEEDLIGMRKVPGGYVGERLPVPSNPSFRVEEAGLYVMVGTTFNEDYDFRDDPYTEYDHLYIIYEKGG